MNFKNLKMFRYKVHYWNDAEDKEDIESGFVCGLTTGDAVDRVESIYMKPNGDSLMNDITIYEIDAYDCGVLTDVTIEETMQAEKATQIKKIIK